MRNWIAKFALLALFLSAPAFLLAQDSSSMAGTVTDATGAVLPDTTVTVSNKLTGVNYTQTTDKKGEYKFANIAPNSGYDATFVHSGFASLKVDHITLSVGITRTQDAKLFAGTNQQVEVSAANQVVTLNTTDASIGNNLDIQQLNQLPVYDRSAGITTLFTQQPGVDPNQGSVTGARVDQTEVTVDGLDVNDIAAGSTFAITGNAPVDSVQQFTGTVAGLTSAVGTGSGGQFQLVTKSGTNQFHGNINEYHRDTTTEANTWFNNLVGLPRTPLIRNQFGGNIGGPIKRDKLFFFFDFADSRIVQSASSEPIVPLSNLSSANPTINYINSASGCGDSSRINTTPDCISSLSAAQVAALDPLSAVNPGAAGFNPGVTAFLKSRYPAANDLTQGDGVNTGGYRFTYGNPSNDATYVGRIDYNLSSSHKIFGRFTINRANSLESGPVFPTDPVTHPRSDDSYGYVVSDIWTIGKNKVNQFYYGDNISKLSFPNAYNPTGVNQYAFSASLAGPYSGNDGQKRRVPIPVVRDDFNWQHGSHSITFGGTFKFIKTNSNLIDNFNFPSIGLFGPTLQGGLDSTLRPADINQGANSVGINDYDGVFPLALGVLSTISTNYTYNNAGAANPLGTGGPRAYRYFETELYVGDTWKMTPHLTLSYGLRYQLYSVPYEAHGEESVEYINGLTPQQSTLNAYVADRLAQSAAGDTSNAGLPFYSVILGGKQNKGPDLYGMDKKDFAPRFAFSYSASPKTVINGGAGIVYDRTVINAINFLQDQISYLFSNTQVNNFSSPGTKTQSAQSASIQNDPRVGANLAYSSTLNPPPAALTVPYTPYVNNGVPFGLGAGETNFVISPNLKDPYSITLNAGIQQEFPGHLIFKLNYAGRLGRRLLADADAGQVLDFPDKVSGQMMSAAFAQLTTQLRANPKATPTAQAWFENVLGPGLGAANGFASNTALVAAIVGQLAPRGDISDMLYDLAASGVLPTNVGIPSQFGANAYLTNQGSSNYHGLLLTLSKNLSQGLHFDFNYTWSHSIDNTSLSANANSLFNNTGFICDITKPRACRGNSDFDIRQLISSNFVYTLPFGRGKEFLGTSPRWLDEAIGGWSVSGLPTYRTGLAVTPYSDTYLASFDNANPAIFTGNKGDLRSKVNVENGTVFNFAGGSAGAAKVLSEFRGPIGLEYGQRNLVNGPGAFYFDAGLAKTFPIIGDRVNLLFRADAFNVFNHPVFGTPALNIVTNASQFGQITSVAGAATTNSSAFTPDGARVAQFSLRLEF